MNENMPETDGHEYAPFNWTDRFRKEPRCRACYLSERFHPFKGWVHARPIGDKSPARPPTPEGK